MTAMVQTDLGPPPVPKYKDDSTPVTDDQRNPKPLHQQPPPPQSIQQQQQHPRSVDLVQQQQQQHQQHQQHQQQQQRQRPDSPNQPTTSVPPGTYTPPQPPHPLGNGIPLQHQSPYGPPPPQEQPYYTSHPSPYNPTSTPGQYPSTEAPDLMAATAQMQRPYPPIYHTPQSNSPASVASPQTHDQHGRSLYTQPPQMAQGMYGYPQYPPMNPVHHSPYAGGPHPGTQQQHTQLTSQPLLVSSAAQMPHQQPQTHPPPMNSSPRMKLDPNQQQPTPPQRAAMNPAHPSAPVQQNNHSSNSSGSNPNAAPGPIPATTPLVVRQDGNGVQWIAFEYSRDRVKLEYTIRCDVESVNVEHLSNDFKTENCVYPRACCSKEQYRGNRLVYETECNAVGWALAELNPCLRGKRGLIQRAVDSWRNSNQDPRLRSRRVRRMAKINNRKAVSTQQHANHMAGPSGPGPAGVPGNGLTPSAVPASRPAPGNLSMVGPALHHHHAHPDGNATGAEDVSGANHNSEYPNGASSSHRPSATENAHHPSSATDLRPAQVFHHQGIPPSYPPPGSASHMASAQAMPPPLLHDGNSGGMETIPRNGDNSAVATRNNNTNSDSDMNKALFGDLPEGKRRKFILVEDLQRGCRVRVKVMLDQVDMKEIPDSYRKDNSVFPRSYFPVQMVDGGEEVDGRGGFRGARRGRGRFVAGGANEGEGGDGCTVGRAMVSVPVSVAGDGGSGGGAEDGGGGEEVEVDVAVPGIAQGKRDREMVLNDLGYRMSWSQSRVFAGRTLFLQRALDAYRNKMRSTMLTAGQEVSAVAPHFETRVGKRKWLERRERRVAASGKGMRAKRSRGRASRDEEGGDVE